MNTVVCACCGALLTPKDRISTIHGKYLCRDGRTCITSAYEQKHHMLAWR